MLSWRSKVLFSGSKGVVKVYDLKSKTLTRDIGRGILANNHVHGLAIFNKTLYVSDKTDTVHCFMLNGMYRNSIFVDGMVGSCGITIYNKMLFICDNIGHDLKVVDLYSYKLLRTIGSFGSMINQFRYPTSVIAIGKKLYVTDYGNCKVKVIDEHGAFETQFTSSYPTGIAKCGKNIVVSEMDRVALYDNACRLISVPMNDVCAYNICTTGDKRIFVNSYAEEYFTIHKKDVIALNLQG